MKAQKHEEEGAEIRAHTREYFVKPTETIAKNVKLYRYANKYNMVVVHLILHALSSLDKTSCTSVRMLANVYSNGSER